MPAGSARRVIAASGVAVVRPDAAPPQVGPGAPATVTFGGPAALEEQLVLRFPRTWTDLEVGAAFLLLEPAPEAEPSAADVPLRVSLVSGSWAPGTLHAAPSDRGPASSGWARTRPPAALRLDVTEQLRSLAAADPPASASDAFLIRAERSAPPGATFLTGTRGGAPRLDVYGHPRSGGANPPSPSPPSPSPPAQTSVER